MLHKGVGVTVQSDGRILVPEDLGKRFYIHTTLNGTGGEGMSQRMKSFVRNIQSFQEQFKTSLVGADRNRISVCRHYEGRIALFLYASENRQQLFRQWYHAAGSRRFRLVYDQTVLTVMTGLRNSQDAFRKVHIAPLQGNKLAYAQPTVQAKDNAVQLIFFAVQNSLLYLLLLGECKALTGAPFLANFE